jgi:hemerythrin-like domain-containing protein
MATKTQSKQSSSREGSRKPGEHKSAFSWGDSNTNMLIGAAAAGAALGFAANMGRKLFVQATSGATGEWDQALATEHKLALAVFDKIEATNDDQTTMRSALLAKLKYALGKHAIEEEMVIYPALRQANRTAEADELTSEHGIVKTYLYELETMPNDSAEWLARVRDFRSMIEKHMREEENDVFPGLKAQLSEEQNAKLTTMMNKEGFKHA